MLNRFKMKSGDNGFVLKEIQEMKSRDTFQSTASKEMGISKKMERYEWGRTTTMRMGMKDMIYSRNCRANERKFQHCGTAQYCVASAWFFVDKSSCANINNCFVANRNTI